MRFRIVAILAAVAACGQDQTWPTPTEAGKSYRSPHFLIDYTPLDDRNITTIAGAVEAQYDRILGDLRSDAMPLVHVTFYLDHAALVSATAPITVPSWASGLATAQDQIHLMSPNSPEWAPYERMVSNLIHEFAHCVSMHINSRIPNNPRWFWESVAIYESGQRVDPRTLAYMRDGQPPSLASLNSLDNTRIYDVGYTIGEFIVSHWGGDMLKQLIVNNAAITTTLGIDEAAFEQQWYAFVRQRYGL